MEQLKIVGIALIAVSAFCAYYAIDKYNENTNAVAAMNQFGGGIHQQLGMGELKAATPAATKYGAVIALMTGIGGAVCLVRGSAKSSRDAGRSFTD